MPELRKDPIVGRWIIIAMERARRPGNFIDPMDHSLEDDEGNCVYCKSDLKPIYTFAKKGPKSNKNSAWDVSVLPYEGSTLTTKMPYERKSQGLYETISSVGEHEVVVETPEHIDSMGDLEPSQIKSVIETYALRMAALENDAHLQCAFIYKNYGRTAGSRPIGHTRSHILAIPVIPLHIKEELEGAKDYFGINRRCIYCDLIQQEQLARERVILQTEDFIAIIPFAARSLFETWILPKRHHCDFAKGIKGSTGDLAQMLKILLQKFKTGLDDPGYNLLLQTAPFRPKGAYTDQWQTMEEDFHWHIELMPQLTRVAGFEKGSGFYICSVPPENMAEYLRGIEEISAKY